MWSRLCIVALLAVLPSCAPSFANVRGEWKPRVRLGYTDNRYFAVTHDRAWPESRGASSGLRVYGGRLSGFVCGTDVWFESDYRGNRLQLLGYVEPIDNSGATQTRPLPAHLEVRDAGGERRIIGGVGAEIDMFVGMTGEKAADKYTTSDWDLGENGSPLISADHSIEIAFNTSGLRGKVAGRRFELHADGSDNLSGTMFAHGDQFPFVLRGVGELWSMPVADQAAILPIMLSCNYGPDGPEGVQTLAGTPILNVNFARDTRTASR
jgi:hypothetical protein